ncbi:hypothetical protein [uncultured Hydrogenophaga sp.]|uniref:hypothetical protein n=1 Tax=uncultured Hydrogenophaga sp. TaxID=199683 RepID=UPI00258BF0C5|nr:hypothetical protein [uncultured Hydrogenophaga sp.]
MTGKALMVGVFGARGTGKSYWTRRQIERARPARLAVWDHKSDPKLADFGQQFTGLPQLGAAVRAMQAKRFAVRYRPDAGDRLDDQFRVFCEAVFAAGNLVMWVDELAEVTRAGRAPAAWRRCVNVGREYGGHDGKVRALTIFGSSQRPGEVDKSFLNNVDVLHTGRILNASDARVLADFLRLDYRELMDLPDWHWIERGPGMVEAVRGGPKPQAAKKVASGSQQKKAP